MDGAGDNIDPVGAAIALTLVRERRFLGLPIRVAGVITRAWRRFVRLSRWLILRWRPRMLVRVGILLIWRGSGWCPARSASWAGDSTDESRSSAVRRDRAVARTRQGLAAVVDSHRAPAEAAGTRRDWAAVAGDARVPAVSDPGRAHRDVVGPGGELSRDHGEAAAPTDLDTGRHACLGIVTIPSGEDIPPRRQRHTAGGCRNLPVGPVRLWCSRPQGENGYSLSIQLLPCLAPDYSLHRSARHTIAADSARIATACQLLTS